MKKRIAYMYCALSLVIASSGLANTALASASHDHRGNDSAKKVTIINSTGASVGEAWLTEKEDGVHLHLKASKLPPGMHGIHFHTVGKCDTPSFESAGAHFNPENKEHGFNNPKGFHDGDLPNIQVGNDGTVDTELITKHLTLAKDAPNSLLKADGTALVIHEKADDYVTDPAGNSGSRIACGIIK
ncbi:MAG: superoxide dismutase family protein [Candidatus Pristimantibacillus sp.]